MLKTCIFCKIVHNNHSDSIIAETKYSLAFNDINPQADTHILIIPKEHIISTRELTNKNIHIFSDMILLSNHISSIKSFIEDGYRWVVNTGENGGQTVDHLHLHLLAGRPFLWPPG